MMLLKRRHRHADDAIAQIDENAAAIGLESFQHLFEAMGTEENVLDDIRLVNPREHALAVAEPVIDEGGVIDRIERRAVGIALQRPDRRIRRKCRDALDQFLPRLPVGDHVRDGDVLQVVLLREVRHLLALHHRAVVVHQFADDADGRQLGKLA